MSSQAYYLAQIIIIVAAGMVVLSAAGFDFFGDSISAGVAIGTVGLLLIVASVLWARKHASKTSLK
ncbi:MAG TPA: hypothetical protein VNA88_09780 [Candidatus Kapabacteria bacterium]|jgi:hypothetical protein|nr:hypothetical protein [Candidatus Kapabacteria bacterium]